MNLKVAVGQFCAGYDIEHNLLQITKLAHQAQQQQCHLLVLPEASMVSFSTKNIYAIAQQHSTTVIARLQALAKDLHLHLIVGVVDLVDDLEKVGNFLLGIDAKGQIQCRYQKVHPYDAFDVKESDRIQPGSPQQCPIFTVRDWRIGLINCYDVRFPEWARMLSAQDVHILSVSAAWLNGVNKAMHWEILNRARAIENTAYVLACGQNGKRANGHSMVIDPTGQVIAGVADDTGIATAILSHTKIHRVRHALPCLLNRRL